MANAPTKNIPNLPPPPIPIDPPILRSPRSTRSLRSHKSQSALSTNYNNSSSSNVQNININSNNTPSLIAQQRHQQQQQLQTQSPSRAQKGHVGAATHKQQDLSPSRTQVQSSAQNVPPLPPIPPEPPHHQSPTRSRAHSDAPVTIHSDSASSAKRNVMAKKVLSNGNVSWSKDDIESLVRQGPKGDVLGGLDCLRKWVLLDGVDADGDGMSQLRIYIWLILLNAPPLATDSYLSLIHRGASPAYSKIRNDTFRTLATDPLFKRRVSEASLIRLLNAIAWKLHDAKSQRHMNSTTDNPNTESPSSGIRTKNVSNELGSPELQHATPVTNPSQDPRPSPTTHFPSSSPNPPDTSNPSEPAIYLQGMNVLAAPFLYAARSESEAYIAFHTFITCQLPGYIQNTMSGVHKGLALVDKCLSLVDPKLADYLASKGMHAEIYAFPSVLTLCACTPPLPEVLCLWDFLFAYGVHLNVLAIVAQLAIMRETILGSPSPTKILRSFPPLQARNVIQLAVSFVSKIPTETYAELVDHAK
ncbi:hypothetical protein MMC09_004066 [Bachmanniomyces sp. S44760]|nr:hypothetical protein [Bachmanniomyces sp. S44760]